MGTLYIVSTPIGNLSDITLRAIETLKSVDYILCEDTRITGKLLHHFLLAKAMQTITDFNEEKKIGEVIADLTNGKNVALVSDAGTPLISDPGFKLVREAAALGIKIESIPGVSAAITALTVSGLPTDKFLFFGYLSKKPGKRKGQLEQIKTATQSVKSTIIFYESPFRLQVTLKDLQEVFGDTDIVICRELTKMHEEIRREKLSASIGHFTKTPPKGEFVILLSPPN